MKKLLTLFFCTGLATAAFSQSDRERAGDAILRGGNRQTTSSSVGRSCQSQIDVINQRYNQEVATIRADSRLTPAVREQNIRLADDRRRQRIDEVNRNCVNGTVGSGYGGGKGRTKVKGNNGNHYGWEKGKGNPHRSGNNWKGKGKDKKDKNED
ncbi:hypothetical protein [Flaviaesturariibacter terrae]